MGLELPSPVQALLTQARVQKESVKITTQLILQDIKWDELSLLGIDSSDMSTA